MSLYDFTGILEWEGIEGWFSLAQALALQKIVKQLPTGSKVVELGSYKGRSSVAIASVLPADSILYCVDHFQGSEEHKQSNFDVSNLLAAFTKNIEQFGVKDKIYTLSMTTTEAAAKFDPESLDLVFVDAAHDYDSVKADLLNWYPKIKPGGFLLCDDYEVGWPGVMRAVKTVGLEGTLITESLWMHQKPKKKS
ncbi:class I SAM-dependent methyltransferase [Phormidium sp. LEGE 05292]|uniref:class I SAM-dependent methyltransferase n=1 Tax=[Phormidium] sp. LEGE 05292 TaxID=767427 RepID=UPI001880DDF3|nr:class I SAM-dependent methyltransferase [Phormidium sp. LEGE 05292]MBE9225624.1 class I SAM-dependent methyltransferase [Phormidium sp. LEGE 05292]